ncbi:MAG: cbb3-type cytochrome c oxidase subunit I [Thermodesulfovibrionales bacterium]|nr:cbb3-type cytochrome c oxidase subunit I [Thermodesulfovibrionales bacterium]
MKYKSHAIARNFYILAVVLFLVQVLVGVIAALQFIKPDIFILDFNIVRTLHINALVFWLLSGLMGATYYVVAEESESEIWNMPLAQFQFWATAGTITLVVLGYIWMGFDPQANRLVMGTNLLNEGREYIEAPRWADGLVALSVILFLVNAFMTMYKSKKWTAIQGVLLGGLVFLTLMYLPGMVYMKSMVKDQFWWWWVIHLWVEGSWEIIAGALLAFMLSRVTNAPRHVLEKWMYIEVGLVMFTGILGTGHHFYWIGTPGYWLWVGGIFSFLEPLPLLLMVWDALRTTKHHRIVSNKLGLFLVTASVILHFVGAGLWGIIHTLPVVNQWTHGTQITSAHGHMAFYGAYVLLIVSIIYITLPSIRGVKEFNMKRGYQAFWWMTISMTLIMLTLTGAGMIQSYMERLLGLDYVMVKSSYNLWFWIFRAIFGVGFLYGTWIFVYDFFKLGKEPLEQPQEAAGASEPAV